MSKFEDDLARGCLPTGEPLECLYGMGWWTEMPEEEPEPDPVDLHIAELEARIAELELSSVQVEYMNEDELPAYLSDDIYSAMYKCSKVDFVRLFPFVMVDGDKCFLIKLPEVQK